MTASYKCTGRIKFKGGLSPCVIPGLQHVAIRNLPIMHPIANKQTNTPPKNNNNKQTNKTKQRNKFAEKYVILITLSCTAL